MSATRTRTKEIEALSSTTISASMQDQCLLLPRRVHERRRRDTDKHKGAGFAPLQQHTFACSVCKALPVLFANRTSSLQSLIDPPTTKRCPKERRCRLHFDFGFFTLHVMLRQKKSLMRDPISHL